MGLRLFMMKQTSLSGEIFQPYLNSFMEQKQLELHTEAFREHREKIIRKLSRSLWKYNYMQFDGERCLTKGVLLDVLEETERGNRFVRQTSLEADVQL